MYYSICLDLISFSYEVDDPMGYYADPTDMINSTVTPNIFADVSQCSYSYAKQPDSSYSTAITGDCHVEDKCDDWNSCMYKVRNMMHLGNVGPNTRVCLMGIHMRDQ